MSTRFDDYAVVNCHECLDQSMVLVVDHRSVLDYLEKRIVYWRQLRDYVVPCRCDLGDRWLAPPTRKVRGKVYKLYRAYEYRYDPTSFFRLATAPAANIPIDQMEEFQNWLRTRAPIQRSAAVSQAAFEEFGEYGQASGSVF